MKAWIEKASCGGGVKREHIVLCVTIKRTQKKAI